MKWKVRPIVGDQRSEVRGQRWSLLSGVSTSEHTCFLSLQGDSSLSLIASDKKSSALTSDGELHRHRTKEHMCAVNGCGMYV